MIEKNPMVLDWNWCYQCENIVSEYINIDVKECVYLCIFFLALA